jgi:hypothetical protein
MSQTFTEDSFAAGHVGLTDLQNMENNFMALKTMFSGSSAPANSTGGMPWMDTGKKLLKIRNSTNGAWLGILSASTVPRFWLYANAAEDGWVVDSSASDRVIAIKGGVDAYNVSGRTLAGSWAISGINSESAHTHTNPNHVHRWYDFVNASTAKGYNSSGAAIDISGTPTTYAGIAVAQPSDDGVSRIAVDLYTELGGSATVSAGSTHTHTQDATWRPAACIGTIQYLDI